LDFISAKHHPKGFAFAKLIIFCWFFFFLQKKNLGAEAKLRLLRFCNHGIINLVGFFFFTKKNLGAEAILRKRAVCAAFIPCCA